jgi:hypothetical protein
MRQSATNVMMVRPASFQFNHETAQSNEFQNNIEDLSREETLRIAQTEFDTMVTELTSHKINVLVVHDTISPEKPDAIFPNNWISMGQDGTMTIFPMKTKNRQLEKRKDIIEFIRDKYQVQKEMDLSHYEVMNKALEGTGSIVYDHIHKIAYGCLSPRTELDLFTDYCTQIGYEAVSFHSFDTQGTLIYHTNVVMCIGSGFVVIGMDTITDQEEREKLEAKFKASQLEIIYLTNEQILQHFAGNMLQVENMAGELFLVMSQRAFQSLTEIQKIQIEKYAAILPVSIDLIEKIGGGSARCMMAEIFLDKKHTI